MLRVDLLVRGISHLITLRRGPYRRVSLENAGIVKNALVAVRCGRIVWAGSEADAPEILADRVVNAGGRVVTPAFVDPHTHLVFDGRRERELWMKLEGKSYLKILEAGLGIYSTIRATQRAGKARLAALAAERLELMERHGTAVVETKTGYGLTLEHEMKILEAIREAAQVRGEMLVVPTILAHVLPREGWERSEYVRYFAEEIIPAAARAGSVFADVFCDKGAFTVEETRVIVEAALRHGLRVRLHSDELANIGCSRLALEYEVYSLDHLEHLPESIIPLLAQRRTVATLLPTSMLSVFSEKKPPVQELRKHGVYLALATDYNPNNMTPSMKTVFDLAVYLYRLTPIEALAAATVNAAYSLGVEDQTGMIREGLRADLLIWDADNPYRLGYEWGYDNIPVKIVGGRVIGEL